MRIGLARLPPRDFWAMTVSELRALFGDGHPAAASVMTRSNLTGLMKRFPDRGE